MYISSENDITFTGLKITFKGCSNIQKFNTTTAAEFLHLTEILTLKKGYKIAVPWLEPLQYLTILMIEYHTFDSELCIQFFSTNVNTIRTQVLTSVG